MFAWVVLFLLYLPLGYGFDINANNKLINKNLSKAMARVRVIVCFVPPVGQICFTSVLFFETPLKIIMTLLLPFKERSSIEANVCF